MNISVKNFDAVIERMKGQMPGSNLSTKDVVKFLETSSSGFYAHKKNNKIPEKWVQTIWEKLKVQRSWILYGTGPIYSPKAQSTPHTHNGEENFFEGVFNRLKKTGKFQTLTDVAKVFGMSPSAVSQWKRKGIFLDKHINLISRCYNIDYDWLKTGVKNKKVPKIPTPKENPTCETTPPKETTTNQNDMEFILFVLLDAVQKGKVDLMRKTLEGFSQKI